MSTLDAIVIGSGPNGLAAAIELARAGKSVRVYEAKSVIGGGVRSAELTLPGFTHDICSAVHPLAVGSPFISKLPLADYGLEFIYPGASLAHPFDDGTAVLLERSVKATSERLGRDRSAYYNLMAPLAARWTELAEDLLGPPRFPHHPFLAARFGLRALWPAKAFAQWKFQEEKTRAVFAGMAAHSFLNLSWCATAAFGLMLGVTAHSVGWPIAKGGSQSIANALAAYARELGGEIVTDHPVASLSELPPSRVVLCDVSPRQLLTLAGTLLPNGFRRKLERYQYGPAAFKLDWALSSPVPWKAKECGQSATVHLGGSLQEIAVSEQLVAEGKVSDKPFVILAQPSLFDPARAPNGQHTLWAYCHVPNGSRIDMTKQIEDQIERFAPGFHDCILARSVMTPADYERHNANLIGGDINGGSQHLAQMFLRPTFRMYSTPRSGLYICSSSTPPGGGVHGLCGFNAARVALRRSLR